MEFSDAQFIGLGVAYGKLVLRQLNKDQRHDRDLDFLHAARGLGASLWKSTARDAVFTMGSPFSE